MNSNVGRFPSAMVGGTECSRDVVARAVERIQRYFRVEERRRERLFQGFPGVSLYLMCEVNDEGRDALRGFHSPAIASVGLEQALSGIRDEFTHDGVSFRIFVKGKPKTLRPEIQEQIYLIGREALINALRHSKATSIEAEVEYLPGRLRVIVRDNGCGIDPQVVRSGRDAHWGLLQMRERAESTGAQLRIWSRRGAGTEVEVCVPGYVVADACA